jgi:hypothetical protein
MIMEPESNTKKKKRKKEKEYLLTFLKLGILLKACDQSAFKFVPMPMLFLGLQVEVGGPVLVIICNPQAN